MKSGISKGVKHIHEGMWYRFHSDKSYKGGVSWKQWVKAGDSGIAENYLNYTVLTPTDEIGLCGDKDKRQDDYFIPASFEKAERLENQLARERKEKEMKGGKLWVFPQVTLARV